MSCREYNKYVGGAEAVQRNVAYEVTRDDASIRCGLRTRPKAKPMLERTNDQFNESDELHEEQPHTDPSADTTELDASPAFMRDNIVPFSRRTFGADDLNERVSERAAPSLEELEAQGFTSDEAIRLLNISYRASDSSEARESRAMLRRLRFTRWLVEHGMLDEFSA